MMSGKSSKHLHSYCSFLTFFYSQTSLKSRGADYLFFLRSVVNVIWVKWVYQQEFYSPYITLNSVVSPEAGGDGLDLELCALDFSLDPDCKSAHCVLKKKKKLNRYLLSTYLQYKCSRLWEYMLRDAPNISFSCNKDQVWNFQGWTWGSKSEV